MAKFTQADLSAKLVGLDSHPGLEHVRRYSPTGVTAQRWAVAEPALGQLWDNMVELEEMGGSAEIDDVLRRAGAAYSTVREFLDSVDRVNATVTKGLAPVLQALDAAGVAVPREITDLLSVSALDPLSLTADDLNSRITAIAEIAALQLNWPDSVAATGARLEALREAEVKAAQTHDHAAQQVLTGPAPTSADSEVELRTEFESMTAPDASALRELQRRIESALQHAQRSEALAQGLLDRRTELAGRLKVYEAKAARLGMAEDPGLMSARRIATGLLSRRPCDLRAVTVAVADYQQMVTQAREKTS